MPQLALPELPAIPSLEKVSPAYAALLLQQNDLCRRRDEVISRLQANELLILERRRANRGALRKEPDISNDRVASLLGDAPSVLELTLEDETAQLRQEARDLQEALNILAQRLTAARMAASKLICQEIEPDLRDLVAQLAERMAEVSHLAILYRTFAQRLNAAGIAWSELNPMGMHAAGVGERGSQFALWLNAAVSRGYISAELLPREIRA